MAKTFSEDFRRFFIRGLAAVLPTVLTIAIIVWVFSMIQQYFGDHLNRAAIYVTARIWAWSHDIPFSAELHGEIRLFWDRWLFWVGFILALFGVYIFGKFLASFFGRFVWRVIERFLLQMPVIKQIYPSVKQVTDFLLAERKMEFSKVVAVEYPRKGIWSMGLVTNRGLKTLAGAINEELVTIFIPSSPTPVTGYTITVKREDVIDLPISIDEALRFTISGGVIQPLKEQTGPVQFGPNQEVQVLAQTPTSEGKEKAE